MRLNRGGDSLRNLSDLVCDIDLALMGSEGSKGSLFLRSIVNPAGAGFLWTSGVGQVLEAHVASESQINGPLLIVPLSFAVVYLFGWGMSAFGKVWSQATRDAERADRE